MRFFGQGFPSPAKTVVWVHLRAIAFRRDWVQNDGSQWRNAGRVRIIQELWGTRGNHEYFVTGSEHQISNRRAEPCRESEEEARKIRRLQVMISMVMSVIGQDPNLTIEEASELAAGAKRAALAMFPDKELAYDLLYKPRLQRLIRERFRLQ